MLIFFAFSGFYETFRSEKTLKIEKHKKLYRFLSVYPRFAESKKEGNTFPSFSFSSQWSVATDFFFAVFFFLIHQSGFRFVFFLFFIPFNRN